MFSGSLYFTVCSTYWKAFLRKFVILELCIRDRAYTSNGATLSVLLYLRAFEDGDFASAWGIGAVLLVLVLVINLAARLAKTKLKQKQ